LQGIAPEAHRAVLGRDFKEAVAAIEEQDVGGPDLIEHSAAVEFAVFGEATAEFFRLLGRKEFVRPIELAFLDLRDTACGTRASRGGGTISAAVNVEEPVTIVIRGRH